MSFMGLFETVQGLTNTSSKIVELLQDVSKEKDKKGREFKRTILETTYEDQPLEDYLTGMWFDLCEISQELYELINEIHNEHCLKND